jgi:hypothetical protein
MKLGNFPEKTQLALGKLAQCKNPEVGADRCIGSWVSGQGWQDKSECIHQLQEKDREGVLAKRSSAGLSSWLSKMVRRRTKCSTGLGRHIVCKMHLIVRKFLLLTVLGLEIRASHLLGRGSTTWATPPALFCAGIFEVESQFCCLRWPWTKILLISASQVARIIDMHHWYPTCFICFWDRVSLYD